MDFVANEILYTEKYRPARVSDCILPVSLKKKLQSMVDSKELTNCLFAGSAGTGKTTVAKAMCEELDIDYILINASLEGNIDVLRNKIMRFASTVSLLGVSRKMVIFDEADYLNRQSTQPALRAFMEEYSSNCGFILTCNFQNRLIEPLWSRSSVFDFKYPKQETNDAKNLMGQFLKRADSILEAEGVTYDNKVVAALVKKHYPDFRRILNELQTFAKTGSIDSSIIVGTSLSVDTLVPFLKEKNFRAMRQWVTDNGDIDTATLFRDLYDHMYEYFVPTTIPNAIMILNDGQKADAIVADKELNVVATLTELMAGVEFK